MGQPRVSREESGVILGTGHTVFSKAVGNWVEEEPQPYQAGKGVLTTAAWDSVTS